MGEDLALVNRRREFAMQGCQFLNIAAEDRCCTGNTVMIPASAVSYLETSVAMLKAVSCIGLAVVGMHCPIDPDAYQQCFKSH